MATEKFTQLPTVTNALMTDIIAAVQAGVSSQETLGQIFSLYLSNSILHNAGNPNGAVAGVVYQFCWDTTNSILYVCTTSGNAGTAVWTSTGGSVPLPLTLANGGTSKSLTANAGGIVWSDANSMEIMAGVAAINRVLMSGNLATPSWSTATYPATTTVNQLLYSVSGNNITGLATSASGTLITNAGGVPSISSTLPTAVQDNITQLGAQTESLDMNSNYIVNLLDPLNPQDACTKNYADTIAGGFQVILACDAATTANLNATQAGAGVGATLTNAGAQVALTIDGYATSLGDRILVKNQTLTEHNGVYEVTDVGSGATDWELTRATDYDTNAEIVPGTLIAVNNGTTNENTSWLETATVVTVDTDPVLFSQFTFNPASFFNVANNLSEGVPATMRTNLGLGTASVKDASDNGEAVVASVTGAFVAGNVAVFADVNGTIEDGGTPPSTLTHTFNCNGRLTLTSGLPVTTSDVTAATTIYFTPSGGRQITLYDGSSAWENISFTQLSIAVPGTTNTLYDVFVYNNAGVATLELTAWTNDTTRATALVLQDGVYVKSGATTRRYVGSFRTTGVAGQTEDSLAKRYVWNYYNRVQRFMKAGDATATWNYSVATYRQANGSTANQLDCVVGVVEDSVYVSVSAHVGTAGTSATCLSGIGVNSTTVNSALIRETSTISAGTSIHLPCSYYGYNLGRTYYPWLEIGQGSGTQTWTGTGTFIIAGITGYLFG